MSLGSCHLRQLNYFSSLQKLTVYVISLAVIQKSIGSKQYRSHGVWAAADQWRLHPSTGVDVHFYMLFMQNSDCCLKCGFHIRWPNDAASENSDDSLPCTFLCSSPSTEVQKADFHKMTYTFFSTFFHGVCLAEFIRWFVSPCDPVGSGTKAREGMCVELGDIKK